LAFDLKSDTAFWLLHSWPKFPDTRTEKIGSAEYGQTYICIQLKNIAAARVIAEQMFYRHEPQTYECRLPPSIKEGDIFYKVANLIDVNETDPPCDVNFQSKKGEQFRLLAKNRYWNKDFWIDLVGPALKSNIDVETWRRGTVPGTEDADHIDETTDILYIDLEKLGIPYKWHYTKDHSKWGITETDDWVCVADINRQTSQEKRGGGTICFKNKTLWSSLKDLEKLK
jgi:deoxyribonuclease-2